MSLNYWIILCLNGLCCTYWHLHQAQGHSLYEYSFLQIHQYTMNDLVTEGSCALQPLKPLKRVVAWTRFKEASQIHLVICQGTMRKTVGISAVCISKSPDKGTPCDRLNV